MGDVVIIDNAFFVACSSFFVLDRLLWVPEPQYHRHVYVMTLFEAPREGRSNLLIVHPENALCASVYFLAVSHIYVQSCIVLFVPMFCVLHCIVSLVLYYVV